MIQNASFFLAEANREFKAEPSPNAPRTDCGRRPSDQLLRDSIPVTNLGVFPKPGSDHPSARNPRPNLASGQAPWGWSRPRIAHPL